MFAPVPSMVNGMVPPSKYYNAPGGPLHYVEFGGSGRPVVLLHGLGGAYTNWLAVANDFTRHGRVYAFDLPGFGLSPPRRNYRLPTHRRALAEFIAGVTGGPVLLVANSLGGLVAEMHAATQPQDVERLILISPATPPIWRDNTINWQIGRRWLIQGLPILGSAYLAAYLKRATPRQQVEDTMSIVCAYPERVSPDLLAASFELAAIRRHMPWAVPAVVRSGRAVARVWAHRRALVAMIRSITAPTLLIQGNQDKVITTNAVRWLAGLRPDWDYRAMSDTAHCPQFDAPSELMEEIDSWLAPAAINEKRTAVGLE